MKFTALILLLVGSLFSAGQETSSPYTVKVDIDLVVLNVTVTNQNGIPVSGLRQEDFEILEDGVAQQIKNFSREDVTSTVGLVIDNSGSMRTKKKDVVEAAMVFARSINPHDDMFLVNFNERVWFGLPNNVLFTQQPEEMETALSAVTADGQTALYDAVCAGLERLRQSVREKKVLIVISDGGDNASKNKLSDVNRLVAEPRALIYTVNLYDASDRDNNPDVLKRLASISGGKFFRPSTVAEIIPTLHSIALDLGSQYTITYKSNNLTHVRRFRSVSVRVRTPEGKKWTIRTRTGYYASNRDENKVRRDQLQEGSR
jgi:Ca-activated chloride channel family protein